MTPAISIDGLTKSYGARVGVDRLTLEVPEGALYGFLGPNGAGKSTTIRTLMGFMRPTGGSATVLGFDCWRDSHRIKADVGYIAGDLRLYGWMNLRNGLDVVGRVRGRSVTQRGLELAEQFDLEPGLGVRSMSRGMRQKLGLILALAHNPKILILDEPTTALDPPMQQQLYAHLRERARDGAAVFFSSHTLSEIEELCEYVAMIKRGRLVANERIDALRRQAARSVELVWKDGAASGDVALPGGLRIETRDGRRWTGTLTGSATEFVAWSAQQPLDDVSVSPPDLQGLFYRYYADEGASGE